MTFVNTLMPIRSMKQTPPMSRMRVWKDVSWDSGVTAADWLGGLWQEVWVSSEAHHFAAEVEIWSAFHRNVETNKYQRSQGVFSEYQCLTMNDDQLCVSGYTLYDRSILTWAFTLTTEPVFLLFISSSFDCSFCFSLSKSLCLASMSLPGFSPV